VVFSSLRSASASSHDVCSRAYGLGSDYLGLSYEVLLWPPDGHGESEASFSVVAASASTDVRVQFPSSSSQDDCMIMFSGVRLDCGQTIDFTLLEAETATFASKTTDLSGTLVDASMPVAVFVNNSRVTIGPGNVIDDIGEQLFPVSAWDRQFIVAPIPDNNQSGYSLRLTSGGAGNVSVDIAGTVHHLEPRQPLTVDFLDNRPTYVNVTDIEDAAAGVQLIQFVRGATVPADSGAPAALVVPSVDRFSAEYRLNRDDEWFDSQYTEYVSVVTRRSDVSGLRLNAADLYVSWLDVGTEDWVTAAVRLQGSKHFTLQHAGGQPFGAYSYGYQRAHCAYAHPAGASLPIQVINSLIIYALFYL